MLLLIFALEDGSLLMVVREEKVSVKMLVKTKGGNENERLLVVDDLQWGSERLTRKRRHKS